VASIAELFKWPLTLFLSVVALAFIFRKPFTDAINRIQRVKSGDHSVDMSSEPRSSVEKQKDSTPDSLPTSPTVAATVTVPTAIAMPAQHPIFSDAEKPILAMLKASNVPHEVERHWLVREMIIARANRAHEQIYRTILGSQIELLLMANTASRANDAQARAIYERARENHPDLYKDFAFENWIAWPTNVGLLIHEGGQWRSSVIGQEFMKYLVENGLTGPKYG
jgi:hypothetical protein